MKSFDTPGWRLAIACWLAGHGAFAFAAADAASASTSASAAVALAAPSAAADAASAPVASSSAAAVDSSPSSATATAAAASSAPLAYAETQQPRSFGHVLGDVLTQRVSLDPAGRGIEPAALPPADRVGLFLERRTPRTERDELGRAWLVIDYQVINAPRALVATALPAVTIAVRSGAAVHIAAWPISIGPLTPTAAFGQGDLLPLRPDRAVEPLPSAGIERQLKASLAALATVLLAWAAWWAWRNWREAQRLPFARAWHRVRRLDEASPEAWLALHHALNATSGRAVHGATLPRLLAEAPHLQPLAARLDAFFRQSSERFFADAAAGATAGPFPLRELSQALREAERRQQR